MGAGGGGGGGGTNTSLELGTAGIWGTSTVFQSSAFSRRFLIVCSCTATLSLNSRISASRLRSHSRCRLPFPNGILNPDRGTKRLAIKSPAPKVRKNGTILFNNPLLLPHIIFTS